MQSNIFRFMLSSDSPSLATPSWKLCIPSILPCHESERRRRRRLSGSISIRLSVFFSSKGETLPPLCHQPPRPAQPRPEVLWCVTSHLALKAVKSQFSDKSNLNLSGDTIYRWESDRVARADDFLTSARAGLGFVWSKKAAAAKSTW